MELLKDLELMETSENDGKLTLTFLDEEHGEIREVFFNKNIYDSDSSKFVPDKAKAEKCEQWCNDYLGTSFDNAVQAIGQKHDVYCYDKFNALWECEEIEKFKKEDENKIFETEIDEIIDDGNAFKVKFKHEGKTYCSKMSYSEYLEKLKKWFVNPQKKQKQLVKFENKFGVPFSEKDSLIGRKIMVEVKVAFHKFPYADIKKLPKASK